MGPHAASHCALPQPWHSGAQASHSDRVAQPGQLRSEHAMQHSASQPAQTPTPHSARAQRAPQPHSSMALGAQGAQECAPQATHRAAACAAQRVAPQPAQGRACVAQNSAPQPAQGTAPTGQLLQVLPPPHALQEGGAPPGHSGRSHIIPWQVPHWPMQAPQQGSSQNSHSLCQHSSHTRCSHLSHV